MGKHKKIEEDVTAVVSCAADVLVDTSSSKRKKEKNKRLSDDHVDIQIENESVVDDMSLHRKKKKKKSKDVHKDPGGCEDTSGHNSISQLKNKPDTAEDDETTNGFHHKRHKKKCRHQEISSSVDQGQTDSYPPTEEDAPRKKHKRSHGEVDATCDLEENTAPSKKDGKRQRKETLKIAEEVSAVSAAVGEQDPDESSTQRKKKHKKKKVSDNEDMSEVAVDVRNTDVNKHHAEQNRKHKHAMTELNGNEPNDTSEHKSAPEDSQKHKKKRRDKNTDEQEQIEASHCMSDADAEGDTRRKASKKRKQKRDKLEVTSDEVVAETKSKEEDGNSLLEATNRVHKSKKKNKHCDIVSEQLNLPTDTVEQSTAETDAATGGSTKSKRHKHKKERCEVAETADSSAAANSSSGRTDESASQNPADDGNTHQPSGAQFGQWNEVSFDAPERQHKFLRLMGGMKTSSSGSLPPKQSIFARLKSQQTEKTKSSSSPSSLAMSITQQSQVERSLEEQFEKARELAFKKQKGIGLGFEQSPGAGKTVYIDTAAVRSKTFDD